MYEQILQLYNTGNYLRFNYVALIMILLRLSKFAYNNVVKTIALADLINITYNNYTRISYIAYYI